MFSSKPNNSTTPAAIPASVVPNGNGSKKAVRAPGSAPSIISADLVVAGSLKSEGDIQIDGTVEGDVHSAGLVIGEKANIQGEVFADDITIRGRVLGRIRARKVHLAATAHVEGDILHEAFAVEAGAFFEGNCRHSDNPLADAAKKPVVQPAAAPATPNLARTGLSGLAPLGGPSPQPAE
jgi:cytoskeletal protein CcmA (bactofilin family)